VVLSVVAVALLSACGGDDGKKPTPRAVATAPSTVAAPAGSGTFTFVGFADHAAPGNFAPTDVTPSGGTIRACNPASLYAFVNFTGLTPPKTMAGSWTMNGAALNQQTINQTQAQANTFWQVQNTPAALAAGNYTFTLSIDGATVSRGQFTLTC
jgi:hypothetical protein